jgi:hypothetical protein
MNRLRKATHSPLARQLTSLSVQLRNARSCDKPASEPILARPFSHPQGAGVIGPGALRLLRTMLVDGLTGSADRCEVVIARADLERLLGAASSQLPSHFAPVLHVPDTLEDAIEHLECRVPRIIAAVPKKQVPVLWLATPGADADVVQQTLESQSSTDLITLFNGPWPYGPTHFIDTDGPRRLPDRDLHLLTRDQAIAEVCALGSPR